MLHASLPTPTLAAPWAPGVDTGVSLKTLLERSFKVHQHLPACSFMGRTLSYGQLDHLSMAMAAYLQSLGLARGERVAIMLPNTPQFLVAVAAVLRAGLVVVTVNPQLSAEDLGHQLRDADARAIFVMDSQAGNLLALPEGVAAPAPIVTSVGDLLGPLRSAVANRWWRRVQGLPPRVKLPDAVSFLAALDLGRQRALLPVDLQEQDIAALQYTGGTTGVSRGAVLLHRNLMANVLQCQAWYQSALARIPAGEQPVSVAALPLHHIFGFSLVLLLGLHQGVCLLLIPEPHDASSLLKVLAKHRFHLFAAVDSLFLALATHPAAATVDWRPLQLSVGGAMAVQATTAQQWKAVTGRTICQGYGLSEASPAVTCNPVDDTHFSGHLGQALPGTQVLVVDDEGQAVPAGTRGEIAIRGPQVMAGYWHRPDETAQVMTPSGHLRTGDIGVFDAQGALRLVDRKKDLIFVSGFNVYPFEVEDVLSKMPGVRDCAAVGMPDDLAGEVVKVVLVKSDQHSASPNEADVRAWCNSHLAGYKRPRVVEFLPELPRSSVGKVLRRGLRERA
jgi:long-chain acyl-CoA synthetase